MKIPNIKPLDGGFENLAQRIVKPVQKTVTDATKTAATDIKQQLTGKYDHQEVIDQMGVKSVSGQQKKQIQDDAQAKLAAWRGNLNQLNQKIEQARQERVKQEQQKQQQEVREQQKKKFEEQKKAQDPVWKQAIKGSQGSGEAKVNAGG